MTGPHASTPLAEQVAEIRAWLDANNRPEAHPAVRPHTERPPPDTDFEILTRVSVSAIWTDQAAIQCNVCTKANKFLREGFIASYANGWWYVVGPTCGNGLYADYEANFTRALNALKRREVLEKAEERLRDFTANIAEWRSFQASLRPAVAVADMALRVLAKARPILFSRLDAARKGGGSLVVVLEQWRTDAYGDRRKEFIDVPHTPLSGLAALGRPSAAATHFRLAADKLDQHLHSEGFLDDALLQAERQQRVSVLEREVGAGLEALLATHAALIEAKAFWTQANLKKIVAWSKLAEARYDYHLELSWSESNTLAYVGEDGSPVSQNLAPLVAYDAKPPA